MAQVNSIGLKGLITDLELTNPEAQIISRQFQGDTRYDVLVAGAFLPEGYGLQN